MTGAASTNLMEELSRQVERVTIIREHYRVVDIATMNMKRAVNPWPAIDLMTAALEAAHQAAGGGDILEIARVIRDLKGFEA